MKIIGTMLLVMLTAACAQGGAGAGGTAGTSGVTAYGVVDTGVSFVGK